MDPSLSSPLYFDDPTSGRELVRALLPFPANASF